MPPGSAAQNLVSVCVPTFNGALYLRDTLDSIAAQTCSDFEVVVCDDSSSDETVDILLSYSDALPLRLFRNERTLGLAENWNRCLAESTGEWIKLLGQDDFLEPTYIEVMLANASESDAIVVCDRSWELDDADPHRRQQYLEYRRAASLSSVFDGATRVDADRFCRALLKWSHVNFIGEPVAVMFRRELVREYGAFDPNLIQLVDFEYWCRLACNRGLTIVSETLATFRVHDSATTTKNTWEHRIRSVAIDPLIFRHAQATDPRYERLRKVARANGIELKELFAEELVHSSLRAAQHKRHAIAWRNEVARLAETHPLFQQGRTLGERTPRRWMPWRRRRSASRILPF